MGGKLRACSGCHGEWYCGSDCQLECWPMHKSACLSARADRACPVCLDTPVVDHRGGATDGTIRCTNGHGVCADCWPQLRDVRCPLCRGDYPLREHVTCPCRQGRGQLRAEHPGGTPRPRLPFLNELDDLGMWLQLGHTYADIVHETY